MSATTAFPLAPAADLAELRDLMAMASHDLKSPLAAAVANLELLREGHAGRIGDDGEECLRATERALRRMNGLVEDLLSYATADRRSVEPRRVDLGAELTELAADVDGEVVVRGPLPDVLADPGLLRHVLENLLGNAVKYTRLRPLAKIGIGFNRAEGEFYVQDNGAGFDMAYASKLFGVFQRLHRAEEFEGTGVGLANVQRIIARHGGRIWAQGKVNEGAIFYFSVPLHHGSHA